MESMNFSRDICDQPFIIVHKNTIIEVSQYFADMIEYSTEELVNKKLEEIINLIRVGPDFGIADIDEKADYFLFTKSFEVRFVNIHIIDKLDKRLYAFLEKPNSRLEDKFQYLERLYKTNNSGIAFYSAPDLYLLKANEIYISFLNEPFNKKENSIGRKIDEIVKGYKGSVSEEIWTNLLNTGEAFYANEAVYDRYDRGMTYWDSSIIPIYEGEEIKYFIENSNEVTERVLQRKKIQEQNELLKSIMDNLHESIKVYDKDCRLVISNSKVTQQKPDMNCTLEQVYNKTKRYKMDGTELPIEETAIYRARSGKSTENNVVYYEIDGERQYSLVNGKPVYDNKGNYLYGIVCTLDITEFIQNQQALKEAEVQLLEAEKEKIRKEALEKELEIKDEFLSIISHELRTPINVISTAIQAMDYICADEMTDNVKGYTKTIKQNNLRQLRLVNNLLDITRANAGRVKINKRNMDIVFLTKVITESVCQYALQKGNTLKFVSDFSKKVIGIDDEKYERILLNLLSNAIKFTPAGKPIAVELHSHENFICIEVKDKGIGIPPNKADLIFKKFGQVDSSLSRQAEGAGIGLSLVKKFIETMGGSISFKSKVGKGSTFTVMLPDEMVSEGHHEKPNADLLDNRLIQSVNVEFSDIYF